MNNRYSPPVGYRLGFLATELGGPGESLVVDEARRLVGRPRIVTNIRGPGGCEFLVGKAP